MLTFRALQLSRSAMLSRVAKGSTMSSRSQRLPRAIEATKVARFSERIGREVSGEEPSGTMISRCRFDAAFCQSTTNRGASSAV